MKKKMITFLSILLTLSLMIAGCAKKTEKDVTPTTPKPIETQAVIEEPEPTEEIGDTVDTVSSPSIVSDDESLALAMSKNGTDYYCFK